MDNFKKKIFFSIVIVLLINYTMLIFIGCQKQDQLLIDGNTNYVSNRPPLIATPYIQLPIGAVKPKGWLYEQLRLAAEGMTGHLDEIYPIVGPRNAWRGGDGDCWERGPYWLDGLVPIAYILGDQVLIEKARLWIELTLKSQQPNGYFGPEEVAEPQKPEPDLQKGDRGDWWPRMVMLKALQSYYEATSDRRVLELMTNYFRYQFETLPEKTLDHWTHWGADRGGENLASIYWLYNRTGDAFLLDLANLVFEQTVDWTSIFLTGRLTIPQQKVYKWIKGLQYVIPAVTTSDLLRGELGKQLVRYHSHVVNVAMAFKQPAVYYQQARDIKYLDAVVKGLADITQYHGQVQGMFSGDELLHGTDPTKGIELCAVVEFMFSLETLMKITGRVEYADRLERVAYNALPAQIKVDHTGRQYYQQSNQIRCSVINKTQFINDHGNDLCFGPLTGYVCCTTNMHQGWPKYVQNMWFATADNGLAALQYAPSEVNARVANGVSVHFIVQTEYPFNEQITFRFSSSEPVKFPLHLRIPGWCKQSEVMINGKIWDSPKGGQIIKIARKWRDGDVVELILPMTINTSRWHESSIAVEQGPLIYALKIEEEWRKIGGKGRYVTWEVHPRTPWNYGLIVKEDEPMSSFSTVVDEVPDQPWDINAAPIKLIAHGKKILHWQECNGMAGPLPNSSIPIVSKEPVEKLVLVPYGCTKLRISEFPVISP